MSGGKRPPPRDERPTRVTLRDPSGTATVQVYRCRQPLSALRETGHPEVRFCDACSRSVFRTRDAQGLLQLVAADACVAIEGPLSETVSLMGLFVSDND